MITEVKLEDLEKKYKEIVFNLTMDSSYGGDWRNLPKEEIDKIRSLRENFLTDNWTNLLNAATVGDQENGNFKVNHAAFIIRGVRQGFILLEDVYDYKDYLDIFNRNKNEFSEKDLGSYKTSADFSYFKTMVNQIARRERADSTKAKGVTKKEKLKKLFVHQSNGYSLYKIPKQSEMGGRKDAYYNASCELGSGTKWCTAYHFTDEHFDYYTKKGPLYIFINDEAPEEKYQYSPSMGQFMDEFDEDILGNSTVELLLNTLKGGLEWIEKNEPKGIGLDVKMIMGASQEDMKKVFNHYITEEEEFQENLWDHVLGDFLEEAGDGNLDNHSVVKKYFKDNPQLAPHNHNNWLGILKISPNVFEGLAPVYANMKNLLSQFASTYKLGDLTHPSRDKWTKPYLPLFYEEVIKKSIDYFTIGNTIDFEYEGQL